MADTDTLWQAVDEIRNRQSAIESKVAVHDSRLLAFLEEFRESRKERREQMADLTRTLAEFNTKLDAVQNKVSEAHGMARFGKWASGIVVVIVGWFITKGGAS